MAQKSPGEFLLQRVMGNVALGFILGPECWQKCVLAMKCFNACQNMCSQTVLYSALLFSFSYSPSERILWWQNVWLQRCSIHCWRRRRPWHSHWNWQSSGEDAKGRKLYPTYWSTVRNLRFLPSLSIFSVVGVIKQRCGATLWTQVLLQLIELVLEQGSCWGWCCVDVLPEPILCSCQCFYTATTSPPPHSSVLIPFR